MRFKGLDLNLLFTLKVLLEERSVSSAAATLHLTQPAVSAALKKLRDYFNDELLVVSGKQMLLSAHAQQILPELRTLLQNVDSLLSRATCFVPASSTRQFTLAANDYFCSVALAPMMSQLTCEAPGVKIKIIALTADINERVNKGEVDLAFSPVHTLDAHLHCETLFREELAILACRSNRRFTDSAEYTAMIRKPILAAFVDEDKPMLEKQQQRIGENNFWDLKPKLLPIDVAAVAARRKLDELIAEEQKQLR